MAWVSWASKIIFSGVIVVTASEIAKKSTIYGALLISIPFMSILSMVWLYNDTGDTSKVADFSEGILWLVLPSTLIFIFVPYLLRRDWSFEAALSLGIIATVMTYLLGIYLANNFGSTTM